MPGPIIGTQGFDNPPEDIHRISEHLYEYLAMIHNTLFSGRGGGLGVLDETNINGDITDTTDHTRFTGVEPYQHHGSDNHGDLKQCARVIPATINAVTITSANAGATYTAAEQTLINEMKTDFNIFVTTVVSIGTKQNQIISAMRAAGLMA